MSVVKIIMKSFEVKENKARKIMENLNEKALAGLVSEHYSNAVPCKPIPHVEKNQELIQSPKPGEKLTTSGKILNHFQSNPGKELKVPQLLKKLKLKDGPARNACERLVKKKILKKTGRGTYRYQ